MVLYQAILSLPVMYFATYCYVPHVKLSCMSLIKKLIKLVYYRHACVKHSHAGIVFTQWSKNRIYALQGQYVAPINMKFGTAVRSLCQISRLPGRNVGIQPPKVSKFRILAINLPLRGESFAIFLLKFSAFVRIH